MKKIDVYYSFHEIAGKISISHNVVMDSIIRIIHTLRKHLKIREKFVELIQIQQTLFLKLDI